MIVLLDTNVVSELIRKAPDPAVEAWAASHPSYLPPWRMRMATTPTATLGAATTTSR